MVLLSGSDLRGGYLIGLVIFGLVRQSLFGKGVTVLRRTILILFYLSLREIQRQVFGYVGGAAYEAVRQVRDELDGKLGGTTTTG